MVATCSAGFRAHPLYWMVVIKFNCLMLKIPKIAIETVIYPLKMVIYCCLVGLHSDLMDYEWDIPSGYVKIAIEHGPFTVDLPIKDGDLLLFSGTS